MHIRSVVVAGLLSLSVGCASATDTENIGTTASALATTTPTHHVILLSGGFGSCADGGAPYVLTTEANGLIGTIAAKSGSEPTVVRTCFGGAGEADRFEIAVSRGSKWLDWSDTSVRALEDTLRSLLAENKPSRLDVYGHSHGGWLAGRVVEDLGPGDADSFTLNVFLSDPISRVYCTPAVVITGIGRRDGCGRFPMDLSPRQIAANTHGYLGLGFQNRDWLHSEAMAGAENWYFDPGQPSRLRALNHRELYTMPLAWGGYESRLVFK